MTKEIVISSLKKEWFDLAEREDYPNNPKVTERLDLLTQGIIRMQAGELGIT